MTKLLIHTGLIGFILMLTHNSIFAQEQTLTVPDSVYTIQYQASDSLTPGDSIWIKELKQNTITDSMRIDSVNQAFVPDSIAADSVLTDSLQATSSKWNFLKGGNDSTYFSFYGHLFEVDDTINVETWKYNNQTHELHLNPYDSSLTQFHIYNPAFQNSINNSFLGNIGNAVQSNLFFEPNPKTDFIFLKSFTPYIFNSKDADYYKVHMPFTKFSVNIGPKEEQDIDILHTQNINKYFNAFIHYKSYTGKGQYLNQETRNGTGIFGGSYNQGRLSTHANYVFSRINSQENGGVVDNRYVTDTSFSNPNEIRTRLTDGLNYMKDRQIFFDQKIGFFKTNVPDSAVRGNYWFSLQYNYQSHKNSRIYEDTDDSYTNYDDSTLHLYANNYNGTSTFDSTYFKSKRQFVRINLEENPRSYPFVGAYVGAGSENDSYFTFNKDTLFDYSKSVEKKSQFLEGGLYRLKGKKFSFSANYKYYMTGFRQNDFSLEGFISQRFGKNKSEIVLRAEGGQYRNTPDYLLQTYYSNHYRWNQKLNPENRTELKFGIELPYQKTSAGARFAVLNNYVYFNNEAIASQYDNTFSVFDAYLNNESHFWYFGTIAKLSYQKTSNDRILSLPEFSGYFSLFFTKDIYFKDTDGHMKIHWGGDVYYWTKYYGMAYSPALAMFHTQNDLQTGNYPFLGVFANFEIKRLRFYLRYEHANYHMMVNNYFLAPNYPANPSTVRYGITWTFYN